LMAYAWDLFKNIPGKNTVGKIDEAILAKH
jgi:hypothetical protein